VANGVQRRQRISNFSPPSTVMTVASAHSLMFVAQAKAGLKNAFGSLRDTAAMLHAGYAPLQVRTGLLLQSGFFLHWVQGEKLAVDAAREAALASGLFRDERELYAGLAPELLTDTWTLVWVQRQESVAELNRRIEMLQLTRKAGFETTPIHLWRAFSTGDASRASVNAESRNPVNRIMIVSHSADIGLNMVDQMARAASVGVSTSRVASTATRLADVAVTFAELSDATGPSLRVMAIARKALKVGLIRLFVRSFSCMVIATEASDREVRSMFAEVDEALSSVGARPVVIGLSANQRTLELLAAQCKARGYPYFPLNAVATSAADAWGALFSLLRDTGNTEPDQTAPMPL
jgi:hypothetical protein